MQPQPTLAQQKSNNDLYCLAITIYFEAHQGTYDSKLAVGWVVLNRQRHSNFPTTICGVVFQPGQFYRTSYYVKDEWDYIKALIVAHKLLEGDENKDPTHGALFFASKLDGWFMSSVHTGYITQTANIGGHRFYKFNERKR